MTTVDCSSDFPFHIEIPVENGEIEIFNVLVGNKTRLTTACIICHITTKTGIQGHDLENVKSCEYVDNPNEYLEKNKNQINPEEIIIIRPNFALEPGNSNSLIDNDIFKILYRVKEFYKL